MCDLAVFLFMKLHVVWSAKQSYLCIYVKANIALCDAQNSRIFFWEKKAMLLRQGKNQQKNFQEKNGLSWQIQFKNWFGN